MFCPSIGANEQRERVRQEVPLEPRKRLRQILEGHHSLSRPSQSPVGAGIPSGGPLKDRLQNRHERILQKVAGRGVKD